MFIAHLALAAVLVPPWQNPDEPLHFAVVRTLAARPSLDLANRRDVGVQTDVLASMAAHGWWTAYSEPVPTPLPHTFVEVTAHLGDASEAPPLYYAAAARCVRWLGVRSVLGQYYALRVLSLLLSTATFVFMLAAARQWFDDRVANMTGVILALVPQFALLAISVSPDPFVFFVAGFVWWQAGRVANGSSVVLAAGAMLLAAAAAVLAKKLAVTVLVQAALLIVLGGFAARDARAVALRVALAAGVLAAAGLAGAAAVAHIGALPRAVGYVTAIGWFGASRPPDLSPGYLLDFTWRLLESAYLVAGWQRFYAPFAVVALALALLLIASTVGAVTGLVDRRRRLATIVALAVVGVQLASIYGTQYYLPGFGTQGRFLFPAIGPFAALCALGLLRWRERPWIIAAGVGALGLLDLMAWMALVPVYARWL